MRNTPPASPGCIFDITPKTQFHIGMPPWPRPVQIYFFVILMTVTSLIAAGSSKTAEVLKDCEARADVIGSPPMFLKQGSQFQVLDEKIGYFIIKVGSDRIRIASNQVRISSTSQPERSELPPRECGTKRTNVETPHASEDPPPRISGANDSQISPTNNTATNSPELLSSGKEGSTELEQSAPQRLVPQENWWKKTGQEMVSCQELYKGLQSSTDPDPSLEVTECPEIYKGVRLMMPLVDALNVLHLSTDLSQSDSPKNQSPKGFTITPISCLIPAKSPISHAGIPFFFRPFDLKKIPKQMRPAIGQDDFNLLYIITDATDRVVGLLFVCETPRSAEFPNTEFLTYNFVLNRKKATRDLKVKYELNVIKQSGGFTVDTWLIDQNKGKCLEIVRWYLPAKIANFIRHVLEIKIGLAPSVPPRE